MTRFGGPALSLLAILLVVAASGGHSQGAMSCLSITHYDVVLTPDFEKNAMDSRVVCTLRNDGPQALEELDFDILAAEKPCGVQLTVTGVGRRIEGKNVPQDFFRGVQKKPDDPSLEGTKEFPKVTRVNLVQPLRVGQVMELVFEYTWAVIDPTEMNTNYQLFPTLASGDKEICLLSRFTWIPVWAERPVAPKKNWSPRVVKPTWQLSISVPAGYEVVVLGGKLSGAEGQGDRTISRWESRTRAAPEVMVGRFDRVVVERPSASVVFFLPEDSYSREAIENFGDFLARAYGFFGELFGPLEGDEIHIAVSLANEGGHVAYAGMALDPARPELRGFKPGGFSKLFAHELAHSWWGYSVTSYGRGSAFVRESLTNFSTLYLSEKLYGRDMFSETLASLFREGAHTRALFLADGDDKSLAYSKGPLILNILRGEMGEETFLRALKTFARRYKDDHATFSDFVAVCNEVSGKDWKAFFDQWCFSEGCPDYRLERFESKKAEEGRWLTQVNIRNAGKGTITCPLQLRMADGVQRETFRVSEGATSTLNYETPGEVEQVLIDPDHNTYQGSGRERRLKMLSFKQTNWEWHWYWRGAAYAEIGEYEKAIEELSRAIGRQRHPAYLYSRGVTYLLMDDIDSATADLFHFIDAFMRNPGVVGTIAYAGVIAEGNDEEQRASMNEVLKHLTGQDFEYHTETGSDVEWEKAVRKWQGWWKENKEDFRLAPSAKTLRPGGLADWRSGKLPITMVVDGNSRGRPSLNFYQGAADECARRAKCKPARISEECGIWGPRAGAGSRKHKTAGGAFCV